MINTDDIKIEYPKFTKEMKNTHTILIPSMLDIHFALFENALNSCGYKTEILKNKGPECAAEGLKYVHNDTCYPALLVIGQFIDALNHRDDLDHVALLITQTGGGCRASNYIHLLRKALIKAGYGYIPVVSLNAANLEKDSGFKITYPLIKRVVAALCYGDFIMYLNNKARSYEKNKGDSQKIVDKWVHDIREMFYQNKGSSFHEIKKNMCLIAQDFDKVELTQEIKPRVGIVGEIYIKYAALGNNGLEDFLISENSEVMVPGVLGFAFYCCYNALYDKKIYKRGTKAALINRLVIWYFKRREKLMINAIKENTKFTPMNPFTETKEMCNGVIGHGAKMGEGWLLTSEMVELCELGYTNIVCAQPFGCLPNHICGKGVMKTIKEHNPHANIVAIDYDPSATKVNQENRIKLMLAIARENLDDKQIL